MIDLNVEGWPYRPEICACDDEFIAWVTVAKLEPSYILHMGPGLHHRVGQTLSRMKHTVISLTISPEELEASREYATSRYTCFLQDIYDWNPDLLVKFDIITMFHWGEMCEIEDERPNLAFDKAVKDWLNPGGRILFYRGSSTWGRVYHLPQYSEALELEKTSGSLEVWKKK